MLKPQILCAMIGILVVLFQPTFIETVVGGAITAIGMLGMKLLEKES